MNNSQVEKRGLLGFPFLAVLGLLFLFILAVAYFFYGLQPAPPRGGESGVLQFRILKGEGLKDIGARLSRDSLVKSITVFKIYSLLSGKAQRFQPGLYELSPAMGIPQIVAIITTGGRNEVTLTIPEGLTAKDVDSMLKAAGVIQGSILELPLKEFAGFYPFLVGAQSLEGFLFPDTYRFHLDSDPKEVLKTFLENFARKGWRELSGLGNWYDLLILASFLEREVPEFNDRQIVAGILQKRLKSGIPLQIDATISYAKCGGRFKNCADIRVTRDDLRIASPYNTYQRLGWTPTPIANPGEAAIKAAASPQTSSYFYYLSAAETKKTMFSKTLEEHNLKRAKYL